MAAPVPVDPVAAATYFVERLGCTAFPVWGSVAGRCSCGDPHDGTAKWGPDNVGKHPATAHSFKDATADVARIRTFLSNPGTPNYGLNAPEGVLAIDVDQAEGLARWVELERLYGALPATLTTLTANGRHYFFRWPETVGPMPHGKLFGFVVRRHDDGYVIGPGSVHPAGVVYDTLRQASGMPYDIAELPEAWAQAAVTKPRLSVVGGPAPLPSRGGRHDWLRDRARYYRGVMDDPAVLRAALMAENARLDEPKMEVEVERAIGEVFEKFPADLPEVVEERTAAHLGEDTLDLLGQPSSGEFPDPPAAEAFGGLLGELVDDLAGGTDASLAGLLGSLVAFAGAMIPGKAYFHREQTSSPFIALVGESSIGRKGTAMTRVMDAMAEALERGNVNRVVIDGLNSGEGLVSTLYYKHEHFSNDPVVGLVFEEEYATLLASRGRDGSTLDPRMRQAFDGGPISNRRSGETKTVNPPYWLPSLIGITPVELRQRLEPGALQSGSANRWLYLPVLRREIIPTNTAPAFSPENRQALIDANRYAVKLPPLLTVAPAVTATLAEYADFLPSASFGLARDLSRRLSIIAFRVALVHALVERSVVVTPTHLDRALALTEYARRGIAWVFGDTIGNPDANLLFRHLWASGRLTRTQITKEIVRDPIRRQAAIDELLRLGRAQIVTVHTSGRARMELQPTENEGTFRAYFQVLANRHDENTENDGKKELSAYDAGNNLAESREEAVKKLEEVPMKNVGKRSDGETWCYFMKEHFMEHRDVSGPAIHCNICSPVSS
jgi:hypothetical protein